MKTIYEATTHEELREAVVALCNHTYQQGLVDGRNYNIRRAGCADRIVPPVPKVWREVASNVSKGLKFRCKDGVVQATHDLCDGTWVDSLSVCIADIDIINDLKANPTERTS